MPMTRKEKLLEGLDISKLTGIEIGALDRPFVRREEGNILYVDHALRDALVQKYRNDKHISVDDLVEVDGVWGDNTLSDAVRGQRVDYVVASHVIEHVPDMITWLAEIRAVLKENGQVRLIIPDRRFTFDYLREETRLADLLHSHLIRARIPQAQLVMDYVLNTADVDAAAIWNGCVNPTLLKRSHSPKAALNLGRDVLHNKTYHDVHCWVFTPKSFARLMGQLGELGLIDFQCVNFHDTDYGQIEFFVSLQPTNDHEQIARSWAHMENQVAQLVENIVSDQSSKLESRLRETREQLSDAKHLLDLAQQHIEHIESSTSWRVTAPLRGTKKFWRLLQRLKKTSRIAE